MSPTEIDVSPCDRCEAYQFKGIIVWGNNPEKQKAADKFNTELANENKLFWCDYYERYFNKSFKKKKRHCTAEDEEGSI